MKIEDLTLIISLLYNKRRKIRLKIYYVSHIKKLQDISVSCRCTISTALNAIHTAQVRARVYIRRFLSAREEKRRDEGVRVVRKWVAWMQGMKIEGKVCK